MANNPLCLVSSVSRETVEFLEHALQEARAGKVVGLAAVVLLKQRTYFVELVGEARRDGTYTRGMVSALEDEVRDLQQAEADAAPAV